MAKEFIEKQDTLNDGREKLNRSITRAYDADEKSDEAIKTSNEAKQTSEEANDKSDYTQVQLDTVTGASTIDPAVEQLKVGSDGQTYPSPDARIRTEHEKVTAQLAQTNIRVSDIVINVKDFGAVGDGITDDTEYINNAITYANSVGGGTVLVPNGIYMIKAHNPDTTSNNYLRDEAGIEMKDNVHLQLSNGTILKAISNDARAYQIVRAVEKENISISGGKILGDRNNHVDLGGEWGYGISIIGCNNVIISDIEIADCWGDGINIQVGLNEMSNNVPTNVYIQRVISTNNRRQGMSIEAGEFITVTDSIFKDTGGTAPECGVCIEPFNDYIKVHNVTFVNCVFENNNNTGIQILMGNVKNIKTSLCLFNKNKNGQYSAYKFTEGHVISENKFVGVSDNNIGIRMYDTSDVLITNNHFIDAVFDLGGDLSNFLIDGNSVVCGVNHTTGSLFGTAISLKNSSIINNKFDFLESNVTNIAFYTVGKNIKVINNELIGFSQGIQNYASDIEIKHNKIHDTKNNGVRVYEKCQNVKISDNIFSNVGFLTDLVIRVEAGCKNIFVERNECHLNSMITGLSGGKPTDCFFRVFNDEFSRKIVLKDNEMVPHSYIPITNYSLGKFGNAGNLITAVDRRYVYAKEGEVFYDRTINRPIVCTKTGIFDSSGELLTEPEWIEL